MEQLVLILFVLVSAAMVGLILLQQGKGADAGASFGSGSSQTVFGASGGGNVLTRATSILAVLFFAGSFALAIIARDNARNTQMDGIPVPALQESGTLPVADSVLESQADEEIPVMVDETGVADDVPVVPEN